MENRRECSKSLMERIIAAEAERSGRVYGASAKVARRTGLSTSFISNVANGNADIGPLTAPALAKTYPEFGLELYSVSGLEPPMSLSQAVTPASDGYVPGEVANHDWMSLQLGVDALERAEALSRETGVSVKDILVEGIRYMEGKLRQEEKE
jgi:transcriptional regulator with XRE-family HTH domain